jgi:hypothetical protein
MSWVTVSLICPTQKLAFNGAYLDGFLGAALLDKFAVPADIDELKGAPTAARLRRSQMKRRSMLLALLANQIVLHNPPQNIDISRLRDELDCQVIDALESAAILLHRMLTKMGGSSKCSINLSP